MAALPYIQLYISDYLADTAHLTRAQSGSYMYLLMNYWQTGKALNNADERLALVARMTQDEWLIEKPILAEFFTVRGNKWTHARMEYDLERVLSKSKKASFAGSQSARKRANKRLTNVKQVINHTEADTEVEADNRQEKIMVIKNDQPIDDSDFKVFWMAYPKKVKKAPAAKSYAKALKKATPDEIFKGLVAYSRTCGTDPKFIANPDSWLNQERWTDSNPQVEVQGSQIQSSHRFGASENAPVVPKFTIEDVTAPKKPLKSWRDLLEESE